jgi:hypothetical protein
MKKFLLIAFSLMCAVIVGYASNALYDFSLTNMAAGFNNPSPADYVTLTAGNGSTVNYTQNLMQGKTVDYFSAQAIYASAVFYNTIATTMTVNSITNVISSTAAYPSGFAVVYSSSAYGFSSANLVNNATFYAFNVTPTTMQLSTGTVTPVALVIGTATAGSFTLTPTQIQATSPFYLNWYVSNDNQNWCAVNASSVTINGVVSATSQMWDFQMITSKYLRATVTNGNYGGIKLNIRGYGKETGQ